MSTELPVTVPINGFPLQGGGERAKITFDWLEGELRRKLVMKPDETISQVIVEEDGLVFCFKELEDK